MGDRKSLGFIFIACDGEGSVRAMSWDDAGAEKDNAKYLFDWLSRGLTVHRIERFEGDVNPKTIPNMVEAFVDLLSRHRRPYVVSTRNLASFEMSDGRTAILKLSLSCDPDDVDMFDGPWMIRRGGDHG